MRSQYFLMCFCGKIRSLIQLLTARVADLLRVEPTDEDHQWTTRGFFQIHISVIRELLFIGLVNLKKSFAICCCACASHHRKMTRMHPLCQRSESHNQTVLFPSPEHDKSKSSTSGSHSNGSLPWRAFWRGSKFSAKFLTVSQRSLLILL